jgi:hypothetical protein
MTMLDDDVLTSLFARAAASFEVPASGPVEILEQAGGNARDAEGDGAEASAVRDDGSRHGPEEGEAAPAASIAEARLGRGRRLVATAQQHRILSVASCVVVVLCLAGTVGAVVRTTSGSGPVVTSDLQRQPTAVQAAPHGRPTTTVPPRGGVASRGVTGPAYASPGNAKSGVSNVAPGKPPTPEVTTPTAPVIPSLPSGAIGQPAKIEQTGTLGLSVGRSDLGPTMTRVAALAGAYGGFVANSQTQTGAGTGGAPYGTVTLQVPVGSFSAVLKQAQSLGKTANLSTKATDVTSQYIDLNARLQALQEGRRQYLAIMAKATTIGDILSVQEQIDTIQQQIEQLQGQLNVLTSETSYSTLTVDVNEGSSPLQPVPLPESGMVRAWHDSVGGFVAGMEGLVRVAGPVLFALVLLGLAMTGGRTLWRRCQRHRL